MKLELHLIDDYFDWCGWRYIADQIEDLYFKYGNIGPVELFDENGYYVGNVTITIDERF